MSEWAHGTLGALQIGTAPAESPGASTRTSAWKLETRPSPTKRPAFMKHSLANEGFGLCLRPVRMEDAAFIVWLRNLDRATGRVGDTAPDIARQEDWLRAYFDRDGDYYFISETFGGIPVGTISIYNLSEGNAEIGRYIIRPGIPGAIATYLLLHDIAFEQLELQRLIGRVVATNRGMLSLALKTGYHRVKTEREARIIGGRAVDMVRLIMEAEDWRQARERLLPVAIWTESRIRAWDERH